MNKFLSLILIALLCAFTVPASATDLSYSSLVPQTGDNELVLLHKSQVSVGKLANGNLASNITASGTTSVAAAVLERVVINTAGSADSVAIVKSGTVTLGTLTTSAQGSLMYNLALLPIHSGTAALTGTLNVIVTGTTAPNLTLSYR
jgi:hypothetical protein